MTQRPQIQARLHTRRRSDLEMESWRQMEWYVTLAGTSEFLGMPEWEQFKWQQECADMHLRGSSGMLDAPPDPIRYPRADNAEGRLAIPLPTIPQMEEVRSAIAHHLIALADGRDTAFGPFQRTFSIQFQHVHDDYGRQEVPRFVIYRLETGDTSDLYQEPLLWHLARLLERHCDQIRRCPHCERVFLQNRRHQAYCSRRCQSVAVMQKRRADDRAMNEKKLGKKPGSSKVTVQQGVRHGQKRR